ncbi:LysR family transcriptional regulator [Brevundimonas sp. Leaf363]|uniref:LysR family transcriptional regulator n=1 Tax=Brevundimonas sp. Leaf363 TaxID=1736353 RepID=UPI0012E2E01B|nr:LysR family transcriptional regulator [Brevundimonas sp. Leaf363]
MKRPKSDKFGDLRVGSLEAFVEVYESRVREATAADLGKVHPTTITRRIERLEKWLGHGAQMLVFDGNLPTAKGAEIYPVAKEILARLEEIRRQPPQLEDEPTAPIDISTISAPGSE